MGDYGVGKTSLIKRFVFNSFGESVTSNIIARESLKYLQFRTKNINTTLNIRVAISDIGMVRHPRELGNLKLENVDGVLLVCDLGRMDTFYSYDLWLEHMKDLPQLNAIALVGNKIDLAMKDRAVDTDELHKYAKALKASSFMTSAKTGEAVKDSFISLVQQSMANELGGSEELMSVGETGMASRTGRFGWVGTIAPGAAQSSSSAAAAAATSAAAARLELTQAQRTLLELRAKRQTGTARSGALEFVDADGALHLKYGGYCYLIKEERSDKSYNALVELVNQGYNGLCIARQYPDEIRQNYELGSVPIYWLTRSGTDQYHLSVNLSKLSAFIKKFLDDAQKPLLFLEGLEYLIIQNDFMSVLKFVQLINEYIRMKKASFIMPINPEVLAERDLTLLEREMVVIDLI